MNLTRLRTLAGHELRAQLGGPLPWAMLLAAILMTMSLNTVPMLDRGGANPGDPVLYNNTPYTLAFVFGLTGFLAYGFFASILAGMSVIRDDEHKISELLHSTPLRPGEYVAGKFGGVLGVLGLMLAIHVLFAMAHFQFGPLDGDLARGPFRPAAYVATALGFAAPMILLFAGLAFAVGAWSRRPLLVFAVPTGLLVLTLTLGLQSLLHSTSPGFDRLLMTFEPSGLRWLFRNWFIVDRGVAFYNAESLRADATLIVNRLVTVGLSLAAVALAARRCRGLNLGSRRHREKHTVDATKPAAARFGAPLATLSMSSSPPAFPVSTLQFARAELRELAGQPALYLFTMLLMGVVTDIATSAEGPLGSRPILTAGGIAVGGIGALTLLICLALLFATVESLHRDRSSGLDAILYATPFPTAALLIGKNLATAAVGAVMLLAAIVAGSIPLVVQPQGRFELWPFVLVWLVLLPVTLLLWGAFVTTVLALSRSRHLTYAVGLLTLLVTFLTLRRESMSWALNWTLAGALRWSDLGVFSLNGQALVFNRLLAIVVAAFLSVLAVAAFARVQRDGAGPLPGLAALRPAAARLALLAAVSLALTGFIAYRVHAGFQGAASRARAEAYREQNQGHWPGHRLPRITRVELGVELEPAARSMRIDGAFTLVNPGTEALMRLPFTVPGSARDVAWTLDGSGVSAEDRSGLHVLTPAVPLGPGAAIDVGFRYGAVHPRGFTRNGGGVEQFILPSGVALHTLRDSFLPVPGYVERAGSVRRRRDDPAPPAPKQRPETPQRFTTRVSVTAPREFTVNSVGRKTAERSAAGRTTVVWETDHPVSTINIVAGRWDVRRRGDTAVYFHPGHDYNVDEILNTLVAARERYSEWFYPYPWKELKLSEFPNLVANAQGFPTNIPFSESIGFLTKSDPADRLAFLVTAHEAAHQWWGNIVSAAEGPGTGHLVEGLAHYSALLLTESEHGVEGRIALARRMEANYARWRRAESEQPLAAMVDDDRPADWTVVYEKGAWVQWMLDNHLGREAALAGIRNFVRRCVDLNLQPGLRDMIEALRPYADDPEAYQAFVDQWFFDVVVPEYRVGDAAVVPGDGVWHVTATVENIGAGQADVEVAAQRGRRFDEDDPAKATRFRDVRTTARLSPGIPHIVSWTVDFPPDALVVDPDARVLQLNRDRARIDLPDGG